jgi:hypothetical protein
MNITKLVKRESRFLKSDSTQYKCVTKAHKVMKPFKYIALAILIFCPIFVTPNWCINAGLEQQSCLPDVYPSSGLA